MVVVQSPMRALALLKREPFDGVFVSANYFQEAFEIGKLLQNERILQGMPDGIVLLDSRQHDHLGQRPAAGMDRHENGRRREFLRGPGQPRDPGPRLLPLPHGAGHRPGQQFDAALATTTAISRSTPRRFRDAGQPPRHLIVTVRDVTSEMLQQQKLAAIHQAGIELADLTPDELSHMTVEERIELLKSNILHFTKDLLNFDVVEIRLLDAKTGRLEPLLAVGLTPEAANRGSCSPSRRTTA